MLIVSKRKAVKQDDLWNQKWQAYKDFMVKKKRRPSKHRAEDLVLFDWFKHSKKRLKRGLMKAERIEKFKQLLSEAENLPRINQFNYVCQCRAEEASTYQTLCAI